MYDKVTLQNNYNNGDGPSINYYRNGAGVFIRTEGDIQNRQAEFIMKGGIIRGNVNDLQTPVACGGGVFIAGFGIFTMEGGVIMDNTAFHSGGGFHTGSRGSFKKTGGIIYGKDAPVGLRNKALEGNIILITFPKTYGYAVCVAAVSPKFMFRNDTVSENDFLSYAGAVTGNGVFGDRENWDNSDKAFWRLLFIWVLSAAAFGAAVFIVVMKIAVKKRLEKFKKIADAAPEVDLDSYNLTDREKEICKLLTTGLARKNIADVLGIAIPPVSYHTNNLYRKLGIQSRQELFVKLLKTEMPGDIEN